MRIGIFGGSFDPVHRGHLRVAEHARRQLALDEVRFVPAASQPLKPTGPHASADDRLAMLRLATDVCPEFVISQREIARGGTSYTVDTLREVAAEHPDAELYFLLGADALDELPTWKSPAEICRLATLAVVCRAGAPPPDFGALEPIASTERLQRIRAAQIEMPEISVSSSEIRRRIACGVAWRDLVPPGVADYIEAHSLYRR